MGQTHSYPENEMPQKKPGSPHKASNTSPAKKAQQPILQFPSVSTRLSSYQAKSDYDSLGLPFKATKRNGTMDLQTFFGAGPIQQIVASGQIIFHLMGDSGVGTAEQEAVADAMASDINNVNHELGPSFMVHLGDVIYGPNKQATYADRFYSCLLYTSDAADDLLCVDLGGRRII